MILSYSNRMNEIYEELINSLNYIRDSTTTSFHNDGIIKIETINYIVTFFEVFGVFNSIISIRVKDIKNNNIKFKYLTTNKNINDLKELFED